MKILSTTTTEKEHIFETDNGRYSCGIDMGTADECAERILNPPVVEIPYYVLRERAYNEAGLTDAAFIAAMRQLQLDGDSKQLDAYNEARAVIKLQFPKS